MILISLSHCTITWIEETEGLKLTQDFLRQLLVSSFPRTHEVDHCATARFHESDAWLSLTLRHHPYEHAGRLELGQCVCRLVHHNWTVWRTSSSTRYAERTPVSGWYIRRVLYNSCSVCGRFGSTQRPRCSRLSGDVKLSRLICVGDCSLVAS